MVSFDPYLNWLGIPPHEQPPSFYRLLGLVLFEANPQSIEFAADRQSLHVGSFQSGPYGESCQQLLSEIAMARFCLIDPQQKAAYDTQLQESLSHRGERAVAAPPPPASFAAGPQFNNPPQNNSPLNGPQYNSPPMQYGGPAARMNPGQQGPTHVPMPGPMMPPAMAAAMGHVLQGPPPPMQAPQMPSPQMMAGPQFAPSAPTGFAPSAPSGFAPSAPYQPTSQAHAAPFQATMPRAAPFPTVLPTVPRPVPINVAPNAAAAQHPHPSAPPPPPPSAIDELENLTSQPSRRRFVRKKKPDYSKEIMVGGMAIGIGAVLLVIFLAMNNDRSKHGWGEMAPETPVVAPKTYPTEKDLKEKAKRDDAGSKRLATKPDGSPLRVREPSRKVQSVGAGSLLRTHPGSGAVEIVGPENVGPESVVPPRSFDSLDPENVKGGAPSPMPANSTTKPNNYSGTGGRDGPASAGGPDDPVFGTLVTPNDKQPGSDKQPENDK